MPKKIYLEEGENAIPKYIIVKLLKELLNHPSFFNAN
jgi:hypothetical protein